MKTQSLRLLLLVSVGCGSPLRDEDSDSANMTVAFAEAREGGWGYGTGVIASAIDGYNHPSLIAEEATMVFDEMPLSGRIGQEPWSGSYWPKNKGGIAYRWRTGESFMSNMLTRDEALNASFEEINTLSPAEKYDLYVGNYNWSLTHRALASGSPREAGWTGYCHGWAPASADYREPLPVTRVNPDGIEITFGSSDIKALLTFFRGEVASSSFVDNEWRTPPIVMGTACGSEHPADAACFDTNPGAFHAIMAHQLGTVQKPLLFDVDPGFERWNQPAFGFRSEVIESREASRHAAPDAVTELLVKTALDYTLEIEPTHIPVLHTSLQHSVSLDLVYTLELSEDGVIVGGQWQTQLQDGGYASLDEVWGYLTQVDDNDDGRPDVSEDEARGIIWSMFRFPDYVWIQERPQMPTDFRQSMSSYDFVHASGSNNEKLYRYFAMLPSLL